MIFAGNIHDKYHLTTAGRLLTILVVRVWFFSRTEVRWPDQDPCGNLVAIPIAQLRSHSGP